jgi:uncharacterized surface protein with fasciclin (FAS1) repeats
MKKTRSKFISSILICVMTLSVIAFSGCVEEEPEDQTKNIVETATEDENFSTLVEALVATGLDSTLSDETKEFTVFAPTNAAFDAVDLTSENLTKILTYHVIPGKVLSSDITNGMSVETVQGKYIDISIKDEEVYINDAKVTTADIECSNGVIHVIDTVMIPKDNIVETAIKNGFDTLVTAVLAAGLETTLGDESAELTVFAPTDAAFAELDSTYLSNLVENDTANLTSILTYHVLPGIVLSSDLSDNMTATTVEGSDITIQIVNSTVYIDEAMVSTADIECSNGVIHVIDKVITP